MFEVDWETLFVPTGSLADIVLRGTLTYIFLFLVLRFFLKRQTGEIGIADLLVIVVVADATQNAMGNDYKSFTEGGILVLTIVFWNYVIDWLGHKIPALRRFTRPNPLPLIHNGKLIYRNLRKELITEEELKSQLRQQGLEEFRQVKRAYIEGDGNISIIKYSE